MQIRVIVRLRVYTPGVRFYAADKYSSDKTIIQTSKK